VKRGLLQAGVLLVVAVVLSQLVATIWTALWGGSYVQHMGVSMSVIGLLVGFIGGDMVWSRLQSADERAFLGFGPERFDFEEGEGLTTVGRFMLVGMPLFVAGLLLVWVGAS
jgi:hypothetical protein